MKSIFLANSFHLKKTRSTNFLIDFLMSWNDLKVIPHKETWAQIPRHPKLLLTFQRLWKPHELEAMGAKTTVVVPMYDDCPKTKEFWDSYLGFKILSFSKTLGDLLKSWGHDVFTVQYYQDPTNVVVQNTLDFHGFFWYRSSNLNWKHIRPLLAGADWKSFHLHVTNPEGALELPDEQERELFHLTQTSWFEKPEDFLKVMSEATVYFAPRRLEGIGQAVLEALARGQCVVSPDAPTMNEYITNGVDGLLYDPDHPQPLDWSNISELGKNARKRAEEGWNNWQNSLTDLRRFLSEETPRSQNRFHPGIRLKGKLIAFARKCYRLLKSLKS